MENRKTKTGFTLIELMVTILLASIVFLGIGVVLADGIRGYKRMFTRIHGDIVNDAYVARIKFDRICRKARAGSAIVSVDGNGNSLLEVNYYSVPNVSGNANQEPDRYAKFYLNGTYPASLMLDTSTIGPNTVTTTQTVASNVTELQFSSQFIDEETGYVTGNGLQMVMTLNDKNTTKDSNHSITITCCSIMHN